jgi:hypothetical protein
MPLAEAVSAMKAARFPGDRIGLAVAAPGVFTDPAPAGTGAATTGATWTGGGIGLTGCEQAVNRQGMRKKAGWSNLRMGEIFFLIFHEAYHAPATAQLL